MISRSTPPVVDAVVLAGGRGSRMSDSGGTVDKPALTVGGTSMLTRVLDAAASSRRVVVVGPARDELPDSIFQTQESPIGGGPVAAMAAGIDTLGPTSDIVVVLAADIPFVDAAAVETLIRTVLASGDAAAFATDASGRLQYLLGAWRTKDLVRALAQLESPAHASMRSIVPQSYSIVELLGTADCDTPDDLRTARRTNAAGRGESTASTLDEARELIRDAVLPLAARSTTLAQSDSGVLAAPLIASSPLPAVNISAMDGYAVRGEGPWALRADIAYAGTDGLDELTLDTAVRIATGAQVPLGATSVIRDEYVYRDRTGALLRRVDAPIRDDTRRRGEDWAEGAELAPAGIEVSPAVISVATSAEVGHLLLRGPVRARVVLSGNEIRVHGGLESGETRDSVGPVIARYLAACSITAVDTCYPDDTADAFDELLGSADDVDILVVIGATGGGAADRLRTALVDADATTIVERVLIRPGGSQITATLPNGVVILGLPGNPLAAISTLMVTAPALVDALTLRTPVPPLCGRLTNWSDLVSDRARIVPVSRDGHRWRADTAVRTAHLGHLIGRDGLAVVPPNISEVDLVELILLHR